MAEALLYFIQTCHSAGQAVLSFANANRLENFRSKSDDLDSAKKCSEKLNWWTKVETGLHALATLFLFISGHFILFLLNMPLLSFNLHRFYLNPKDNGLDIYHADNIKETKKLDMFQQDFLLKFLFHLACLGVYSMSTAQFIFSDDGHRHDEL